MLWVKLPNSLAVNFYYYHSLTTRWQVFVQGFILRHSQKKLLLPYCIVIVEEFKCMTTATTKSEESCFFFCLCARVDLVVNTRFYFHLFSFITVVWWHCDQQHKWQHLRSCLVDLPSCFVQTSASDNLVITKDSVSLLDRFFAQQLFSQNFTTFIKYFRSYLFFWDCHHQVIPCLGHMKKMKVCSAQAFPAIIVWLG